MHQLLHRFTPLGWSFIGFGLLLLALSAAAPWVNAPLQFSSALIEQGQWWRLYTAHFVHLNLHHGLMNVLGFWACCYFFHDVYRWPHFLVWLLVGPWVVGLAMWWLDASIPHYVGLSGLLYGWLMLAIVAGFFTQPLLHALGFVVLAGRLVWEQTPNYNVDYLLNSIGGVVYVNAHLYGGLFGLILGVIMLSFAHQRRKGLS